MSYAAYQIWKSTPLKTDPYLSIVIPTYNEEARIVPTIGAIASYVSTLGIPWELIIADDGSKDNTIKMIATLGLVNLRLLVSTKNQGKGHAVQRGVLTARGGNILFVDADNSTPIEELDKLLTKVDEEGYPIAVGSRLAASTAKPQRLPNWLLTNEALRWLIKYAYHIKVQDTQCGFKLFSHSAAQHLFSTQTLKGFAFDLEILYLARKFGYAVAEVPVAWIDAPGSKLSVTREMYSFLRDLIRIKLNDWRGFYHRHSSTQPGPAWQS